MNNASTLATIAFTIMLSGCGNGPYRNVVHKDVNYLKVSQNYLKYIKIGNEWDESITKYPECCEVARENLQWTWDTQYNIDLRSKDRAFHRSVIFWISGTGVVRDHTLGHKEKVRGRIDN